MLSDGGIRLARHALRLGISPWDDLAVQPCSYDVRLGDRFLVYPITEDVLDCAEGAPMLAAPLEDDGSFLLGPAEFALACTEETVTLSDDLAARIEGKSSLARRGLAIHTAGFIDAGFSGQITLELTNLTHRVLRLWPGMRIGQLAFFDLDAPAQAPYGPRRGSHYQGQTGPTPSAVHRQIAELGVAHRR
jgi:dCTP deaminase